MKNESQGFDVIVIGAGAAGLMCAAIAGKRGRRVLVLDHARKIGEKIRISGGGRCNFTNIHTTAGHFISQNPHFAKSALRQYSPQNFIELVERHNIAYHEKTLGQLFCDHSAQDIIDLLLREARDAAVDIQTETTIEEISHRDGLYHLETTRGRVYARSLVVATGGLSIPKIGATKFGYDIARQFGLAICETRAALVPLTFQDELLARCKAMAGLSLEAKVSCAEAAFSEGFLFTHRGLSGPSILQISSYWREGRSIIVDLAPQVDVASHLLMAKKNATKQSVTATLAEILPNRLAQNICDALNVKGRLAECSDKVLRQLSEAVNRWQLTPAGSEGYRTAEVTLGGVDTKQLSSKTMEAIKQPGLFFVGEVVDVTGHLGGYNFQWAWSSGYAAGQAV